MTSDTINSLFEVGGGCAMWYNVKKVLKDKKVKGFSWISSLLFLFWAGWNVNYYDVLKQYSSEVAALFLLTGQWSWTFLAWYYRKNL